MERDWDAEEQVLRAKATEAFETLMGIKSAVRNAKSRTPIVYDRYLSDDALDAFQKAKTDLAAFLDERRQNDESSREV